MKFLRSFLLFLTLFSALVLSTNASASASSAPPPPPSHTLSETRVLFKAASLSDGIHWGRASTVDKATGKAGLLLLATPPPLNEQTPIMCYFNILKGTPIGKPQKGKGKVYVEEKGRDLLAYNLHTIKPAACGNILLSTDPKKPPASVNGIIVEKIKGLASTDTLIPIHLSDNIDLKSIEALANSYTESAWSKKEFALKNTKTHIKQTMGLLSSIMTVLAGIDGATLLRIRQVADLFHEILKGDKLAPDYAVVLRHYMESSAADKEASNSRSFIEQQLSKRMSARKLKLRHTTTSTSLTRRSHGMSQQRQLALQRADNQARREWATRIVHEILPKVHHYSHITYQDKRYQWNLNQKDVLDYRNNVTTEKPFYADIPYKHAWKVVHHREKPSGDQDDIVHMINKPQMKLLTSVPAYKVNKLKDKKYPGLKKAYKINYKIRWDLKKLQEKLIVSFMELKRKVDEGGEIALILENRLSVYTLLYYAGLIEPSINFYHHPKDAVRHNHLNLLVALVTILKYSEPPLPEPESHLTLDYFAKLAEDVPKRRDLYKLRKTDVFKQLTNSHPFKEYVDETMQYYVTLKKALASEMIHSVSQGVFARYFDLPEWRNFTANGVDKLIDITEGKAEHFVSHSEWFQITEDGQFSGCPNITHYNQTFQIQYKSTDNNPFVFEPSALMSDCFTKQCASPAVCSGFTGWNNLTTIHEDEKTGSASRRCCSKGHIWGRPRSGVCVDCYRTRFMTGWTQKMTYLHELNPMEKHHQLTRRYVELIDKWFNKVWKKRKSA